MIRSHFIFSFFFFISSHSLLAARLLSKIREEFSIELTVKDLFLYPTVSDMANVIDDKLTNGAQKYR